MSSILLLPGDGIGPEVIAAARTVLDAVHPGLEYTERPVGLAALRELGAPYEPDLIDVAMAARRRALRRGGRARPRRWRRAAARGGAVRAAQRARPLREHPADPAPACCRRDRRCARRTSTAPTSSWCASSTGGLYFGDRQLGADGAFDTCSYSRRQIERVVDARLRARANAARPARVGRQGERARDERAVAERGRRGRRRATRTSRSSTCSSTTPPCSCCSARRASTSSSPRTSSATSSATRSRCSPAGSGCCPSASFGDDGPALYEPAHGSAPDIAGDGSRTRAPRSSAQRCSRATRSATRTAAAAIEQAVDETLAAGIVTPDLGGSASTDDVTAAVIARLTIAAGRR